MAALAYLRTSVVNGSRSALRRRRTVRTYADRLRPVPEDAEPADRRLMRAAVNDEVLSALRVLPPRQREVLVLRYWSDLPSTRALGHHQRGPGAAAPHEEPRGAIPWAQVGPGWSAASWATSSQATSATLYLVSPSGTRYAIGDHPADRGLRHHVRRSPHPHRLERPERRPGMGRRRRDVAHDPTRPARARPTRSRTARPCSRPTWSVPARGRSAEGSTVRSSSRSPPRPGMARITPDGLDLVAGTTSGLAVDGNATGTVIRTLPAPSGYGSCQVVSWWPDGRALTRCALGGNGVANLWLYPLDGSPATALTAATAASATPSATRTPCRSARERWSRRGSAAASDRWPC